MYIKSLQLLNFRNYENLFLNFNKEINFFIGSNGQGKTNILEAIYLLSIGKSFRTNKDKEMINFEGDNAYVGCYFSKNNQDNKLEIVLKKDDKKGVKVNKVSIDKFSMLLGNLNVVIFSPEDLKLIKDGPKERRKFIDREISQIIPKYYYYISSYNKILTQRNKILKSFIIDDNLIDVYDEELANFAAYIYVYRRDFVNKIQSIAKNIHNKLTNNAEKLTMLYVNELKLRDEDNYESIRTKFLQYTKANRNTDKHYKTTKLGPHKDDIDIFINGINAKLYGSQGQVRTCSISLKLSEIELIKNETNEYPVLLLDDIFSELDETRQKLLINNLYDVQMFITSAEENHKKIFSAKNKNIYYIDNGTALNN